MKQHSVELAWILHAKWEITEGTKRMNRQAYIVGYMGKAEVHYWTPEEAAERVNGFAELGMTMRKAPIEMQLHCNAMQNSGVEKETRRNAEENDTV